MSMLLGIGTLVLSAAGVMYVARKGWLAFHQAVGITPGTMRYIEPHKLPPPQLMQLNVAPELMSHLPPAVVSQLKRIDEKADIYQQWQDELSQQGHTVASSEAQFVTSKLLSERIPEMLANYHALAQYQQQLSQVNGSDQLQVITSAPASAPMNSKKQAATLGAAYSLLLELLSSTEKRLDELLESCCNNHYQELNVMKRYLESLD